MIKKHPWRFAFALFAAILLMRTVTMIFPRTVPGPSQLEKHTQQLVASYSERNKWIIAYFDRNPNPAIADFIRAEARKAEVLGASILENIDTSSKRAELKRDVAQYMKHQCNISQRLDSSMSRNRLSINASYSRDRYNKTVYEETGMFRKMFGGTTVAPDCKR